MGINRNPSAEEATAIDELARETSLHAHSYLRAAKKLARGTKVGEVIDMKMPLNFLLGHACELALKSILIKSGFDDNELKRVGHGLLKAIAACRLEGVVVDPEFETYCRIMDPAHSGYLTRYAIRSFPWVGYDAAIGMISAQMQALPWTWPDEGDETSQPPEIRSTDLVKIRGLHGLWVEKSRRHRSKHKVSPDQQLAWGEELLADLRAVYGEDVAYQLTRKYPAVFERGRNSAEIDAQMSGIAGQLDLMEKDLSIDRVSQETPNLASVIDVRLGQLRSERPRFGVDSPFDSR